MPTYEEKKAAKAAYRAKVRQHPAFEIVLNAVVEAQIAAYVDNVRARTEEALIKERCEHPAELREYWQDPSGNNGGGWMCDFCGKDL